MHTLWLALSFCCLTLLQAGASSPPMSASKEQSIQLPFTPASITHLDTQRYLVADYKFLYLADFSGKASLKQVPIVGRSNPRPAMKTLPTEFNPTGVYHDSASGLSYIANYSGGDVLVGRLQGPSLHFLIERSIAHPTLQSPENVITDRDAIYVADYDGGAIFAFGHDGTMKWRAPLGLAHGVFVDDRYVYATGLASEKLIRLDRVTGERRPTGGALPKLFYPTHITAAGSELLIVDANIGQIVFVTRELREVRREGSMGPQRTQLFRPYSAARKPDGGFIVADTEKQRLIEFGPRAFSGVAGSAEGLRQEGTSRWPGAHMTCSAQEFGGPFADLLADTYALADELAFTAGFQVICITKGTDIYSAALLPVGLVSQQRTFLVPLGHSFIDRFKSGPGDAYIFGSPGNESAIVYDLGEGLQARIDVRTQSIFWGPDESGMTQYIRFLATTRLDAARRTLKACANDPLATHIRLSLPSDGGRTGDDFLAQLTKLFHAKAAVEIVETWRRGGDPRAITRTWLARGDIMSLEDAFIVGLMGRTTANQALAAFEGCRKEPWTVRD